MATITGTSGSDALDGSADPDQMDGDDGDDVLHGHGDDDLIHGVEGDDRLYGGDGDDTLDGGAGSDRLVGNTGADVIVIRDGYGSDVVMDFDPGTDRVLVSAARIEHWDDVKARLGADGDGTAILKLDDGTILRFEGLTPDRLSEHDFLIDPPPVCLAAGTRVATPQGQRAVEALVPGDLVLTLDHGPQPVLWAGVRRKVFGHGPHPHQPVVIPAGAFGAGLPARALRLSPQHRVMLASGGGALGRAKGFVGRRGIAQPTACGAVAYHQILTPRHSVIFAEGLGVETFWPGAFAMETLPDADRAAILAAVPQLGAGLPVHRAYGLPARVVLSLQAIRALPDAALLGCGPATPQAEAA